jgi:hypothetical protein
MEPSLEMHNLIHAQVVATFICFGIAGLFYFNILLFQDYLPSILWGKINGNATGSFHLLTQERICITAASPTAFLFSQALKSWRKGLVAKIKVFSNKLFPFVTIRYQDMPLRTCLSHFTILHCLVKSSFSLCSTLLLSFFISI